MLKNLLILGSLSTSVFATASNETMTAAMFGAKTNDTMDETNGPKPGDYDYDLFRKDVRVVFVNAEFLYWTASEGSLDYAIKMKKPAWGPTTDASGSFQRADFGWNPGFRGNIGYFNAPNFWDLYGQYTYYKGTGTDHAHAPKESDLLLNGTWPEPNPTGTASLAKAHSDIKLRIDLVEFLVTRRFHPNAHLRMRLYGGIDAAWLRQSWAINYTDTAGVKSHLRNQWRFNGAGLRLGYIVDWYMHIHGFYLTGAISVAGFAGSYKNISRETSHFSGVGFNPALPLRNAHYKDNRLISHVQVMAGPSWQQYYTNYRVEVFAGYEFNMWNNLHEVYRSIEGAATASKPTIMSNCSIGLQGLTVRANLDF
jgi:hypothetical protein